MSLERKLLLAMVVFVALIAGHFAWSQKSGGMRFGDRNQEEFGRDLEKAAEHYNRISPMMLADRLSVDSVTAIEGRYLLFYFTITAIPSGRVNPAGLDKKLRGGLIKCLRQLDKEYPIRHLDFECSTVVKFNDGVVAADLTVSSSEI